MDNSQKEFLSLLQEALERGSNRGWNAQATSPELTAKEARGKVAEVFRTQRINGVGAKNPAAELFAGICALQDIFPSVPKPPSESEIEDAIEQSQTDYCVFQALRLLTNLGVAPHSQALKSWDHKLRLGLAAEPTLPKGPFPYRDAHRNMLIVSQIKRLEKAGFKPTRNDQRAVNRNGRESGCDIVVDAMASIGHSMSHQGVKRVWSNREDLPQPEYIARLIFLGIMGAAV